MNTHFSKNLNYFIQRTSLKISNDVAHQNKLETHKGKLGELNL